jgi:DNA-directed RNA polymerase subunit beta
MSAASTPRRRNRLVSRGEGSPVVSAVRRERRSFAKIPEVLDVPNLIAIQRDSFKWFLDEGLRDTFHDISPIEDFTGTLAVEFGAHEFGDPKYSVEECKEKDMSYQAPLFVEVRFINKETGEIRSSRCSWAISRS